MVSDAKPRIAFFCATYLEPEMWHIHRQISALKNFERFVIAQKLKNEEQFPPPFNMEKSGNSAHGTIYVINRSRFRFIGRFFEKNVTGHPWQISRKESDGILDILRKERANLLHVFFGNVAVHLLPLLRACTIPVVVSFHGADVATGRMTTGTRKALQEVFERAAIVGCRSEALKRDLVALGCSAEKLRIFRTVVPQRNYAPRSIPADGTWRFIQACRLLEKKGVDLSLRAFTEFSRKHPNAELVVAGDGPEKTALHQLAAESGLSGKVRWTGFLSQADLRAELQKAHVFLHPSRTTHDGDREGIPNALLEAMAAGIPVIATEHGGIPEAVTSGREGFLVPENDLVQLTAALQTLTDDHVRYQEMSRAAYDRIQREFSEEVQTANLEKIYGELMR